MTRPDAQVPPAPPQSNPQATEAEYVRKLALAILSTLQTKGLLSAEEVDAVLIAARRAAHGVPSTPTPAPPTASPPRQESPALRVTVQAAPPLAFHTHARAPQGEGEGALPAPTPLESPAPEDMTDALPALPEAPARPPETAGDDDAPVPSAIEAPSQPLELGPDTVRDAEAVPGSAARDAGVQDGPGLPETQPDNSPDMRPGAGGLSHDEPGTEIEPPAQTIVLGPDGVGGETTPESLPTPSDALVLDGFSPATPAEQPEAASAVPTFDLKLD